MTRKSLRNKLKRKKKEPEPRYRKLGEVAVNLSGLSDKGKITILKAFAEDEARQRKKKNIRQANKRKGASVLAKKKPKLINLSYPPPGMSQEEIAGFWGKLTPQEVKDSEDTLREARERMGREHRTRNSYGI
jgi:Icc-related predicted phosphoesterase